jgi:hypothetical protein
VGFAVAPRTASTASTGRAFATFDNISFLGVPAAPAGFGSTPGAGQVSLAWAAVPTATTYTVRRTSSLEIGFETIATGLTSPAFTDTTVLAGNTYYYTVTATNAVGEGAASEILSASPLEAVAAWRLAAFSTSSNSGMAADTADPDGDGVPNLVEYATGGNPNQAGTAITPSLGALSDRLRISFLVGTDPWITYQVQATSDLVSGSWTTVAEFRCGPGVAGLTEVQDLQPTSLANRRFMRLVVTHSPPP